MYKKYIKRLLDIVIGLLGTLLLIPITIIVAPVIYFSDRGPVFYNADRLGYNCRHFKMFKFRSMKVNAPDIRNSDGSTFNSSSDPRVTRVGRVLRKTSLDEFPQFFNVLLGQMSLVGPRPGTIDSELNEYERKRRSVRPGITGYSQALFRNADTMKERMANDCYYADNVSFMLDCYIVVKTVAAVFGQSNIYRN